MPLWSWFRWIPLYLVGLPISAASRSAPDTSSVSAASTVPMVIFPVDSAFLPCQLLRFPASRCFCGRYMDHFTCLCIFQAVRLLSRARSSVPIFPVPALRSIFTSGNIIFAFRCCSCYTVCAYLCSISCFYLF